MATGADEKSNLFVKDSSSKHVELRKINSADTYTDLTSFKNRNIWHWFTKEADGASADADNPEVTKANQTDKDSNKFAEIMKSEDLEVQEQIKKDRLLFRSGSANVDKRQRAYKLTRTKNFKGAFEAQSFLSEASIHSKTKQYRSVSLKDNDLYDLHKSKEEMEEYLELKRTSNKRHSVNIDYDPNDMKKFEEAIPGRKWRSASLIAAQSIIEEEVPILKNNAYEELAIEAKLDLVNECTLFSRSNSVQSKEVEQSDAPVRKVGICERNKRDRRLVSQTLYYYQRISGWFVWLMSGED